MDRRFRLPSHQALAAKAAAEATAREHRLGLNLPERVKWFNGRHDKFRKGERLRCIDSSGLTNMTVGNVYVALADSAKFVCVNGDNGNSNLFLTRRFELAPEEPLKAADTPAADVLKDFPAAQVAQPTTPEPVKKPIFNIGDRLMCIDPVDMCLTRGKVYLAVHVSDTNVSVWVKDDRDYSINYRASRFQLAPAEAPVEAPKFKAGDRLLCVDSEDKGNLTKGKVYVARSDSLSGMVIIECADDGIPAGFFADRFELVPAEEQNPADAPAPTFRKGDRLRCIRANPVGLTVDKCYVALRVRTNDDSNEEVVVIGDQGLLIWYPTNYFELAPADAGKAVSTPFRKGDRLVCVDAVNRLTKGNVYVAATDQVGYAVCIYNDHGNRLHYDVRVFELAEKESAVAICDALQAAAQTNLIEGGRFKRTVPLFRKGDRFRCIRADGPFGSLTVGKIYVAEFDSNAHPPGTRGRTDGVAITDDCGQIAVYRECDFTLAPEENQ